ncbi:YqiA/YcfP family alpha/beta fold hydrolase [Limnohabitans sp. T6-20]|uniref:YqiA/YcfP family alpha/beta fold hydrolase n=1 Tax=Limnohabitans sp. T6-20 TaxID=1100725 RepID=UPI000D37B91E|nr:YqiA/YcfP family alpha/beta fold hydrolase [Limnohabitans sp. T6-20]PUE08245.1 esterase [Limnohabitans sp. T6-20]
MARTTHLLYLHGFRSSPSSVKARKMASVVQNQHPGVTWWCPALPASPQQAMAMVLQGVSAWPKDQMAIVGSSLGGFYAAWLSQELGCPAVLLNPAVHPTRDLARYIGEHPAWHDPAQKIFFEAAYVQELADMQAQPPSATPRTLAVIAKGDEVLDWREMLARHQAGQVRLLEGSDHALSDFDDDLPEILEFLRLA